VKTLVGQSWCRYSVLDDEIVRILGAGFFNTQQIVLRMRKKIRGVGWNTVHDRLVSLQGEGRIVCLERSSGLCNRTYLWGLSDNKGVS
jgi:hypothetical protein